MILQLRQNYGLIHPTTLKMDRRNRLGAYIPVTDRDALLFRRRRLRSARACYPCRRRKVKCDLGQPCGTCTAREQQDLCEYPEQHNHDHASRDLKAPAGSGEAANVSLTQYNGQATQHKPGPHNSSELLSSHLANNHTPKTVAQALRRATPGVQHAFGLFGFEMFEVQCSTNMFPFMNLWHLSDGLEQLYLALPENDIVLR